jgi:hypothetical protein
MCYQRPDPIAMRQRSRTRADWKPCKTGSEDEWTPQASGITNEEPHRRQKSWRGKCYDQWAWVDLDYRPHAYQACALTCRAIPMCDLGIMSAVL